MIRIGQDLRQPDGGRADRIREAEGSRATHRRHRHRPRATTRPTRCCKRAKWNVKAAIVMQKAEPDAAAGAEAADARPTTRSAKRSAKTSSRRLARAARSRSWLRPARLLRRRAASSISSTSRCSCRNDAGSRVVIGPFTTRSTHRAFDFARRDQHDRRAPAGSSPSPSTAPRAAPRPASPPNSAALLRRVSGLQLTRCVPRGECRAPAR